MVLDLADAAAVRAAAERIGGPVIVQPQIQGGVELLAGVAQDPVFGPLVAFGPGGVMAELIGDAHFRLTPLTDVDADELVASGKAGKLVAGFRGAPAADAAALADILNRLSRLADDLPELAELDLNPVIGLSDRRRRRRCADQGCPAASPHRRQELVAIAEPSFLPEQVQQLRDRGLPVIALGSIVLGGAFWLAGEQSRADLAWAVGAIVVLVPLVVSTARSLLRGDVGVDAIALVAIVWALALGRVPRRGDRGAHDVGWRRARVVGRGPRPA